MEITEAKVIITRPGRNFVTLKITTKNGTSGLGDGTVNGRELAVASYMESHVIPCLIGMDASRIEHIWQYLYKGAYWRRGPITMAAIGAVDTALWDIKAKAAKLPLYQVLGGKTRDRVLVYCHAFGHDIPTLMEIVQEKLNQGYKAVRLQTSIPGLTNTYGIPRKHGSKAYEPADGTLPNVDVWNTAKYLNHVPKIFEVARKQFGDDLYLLHDAHHRLTPLEAAQLGKSIEPFRPFWLEDVTPAENQEAFKLVRRHSTVPLAVGEIFNSIWDYKDLITNQLIDYVRLNVHAGGISHLRKIANLAEVYQIRTGCFGPTDLSPVAFAAQLHFNLSISNFGIQEYMAHTAETHATFRSSYFFDDGYMHVTEEPGIGVTIDEEEAAKYTYKRGYLPVNTLEDGSIWSW